MPLSTNYSFQQSALLGDLSAQEEDGVLDYAGYGTAAAVISGATGLVNTVIGVGEMLGVADQSNYIDEGRVVTSLLGQEGGEFYLRHKEGVDFAGMILSSIAPGAAGVKLLRAAQKSGLVYNPLKYSTALKNADILLDSPIVQRAKAEALRSNSSSLLNPEFTKAIGAGFKQQVLENVASTAGIVLLNNQNTTMNPDDLSYLEAAGSQLVEGLPFIGVGAVVGTAVDALRIGGAVRRFVKEEHNKVIGTTPEGKAITAGAVRNLKIPELQGMNNGDSLIALAVDSSASRRIQESITVVDGNGASVVPENFKFAYNNIKDSNNIRNKEFLNVAERMNGAGKQGFKVLKDMFDDISNANADRKYALAAMERITPVTPASIKSVDSTAIIRRKGLDSKATAIEAISDSKVVAKDFASMYINEFLGVSTRLAQAGTKHGEVLEAVAQQRLQDILKNVDKKLVKQYGSPIAALSKDAPRLHAEGKITDEVFAAIQPQHMTAFINSVTKEVRTKITPRISDYGETKLVKSADIKGAQLYSPALRTTFKYSEGAFSSATVGDFASSAATLPKLEQLDANFHIAHTIPVNYARKSITMDGTDIAQLERLFKDLPLPEVQKALTEGRITINGASVTAGAIQQYLISGKSRLIANLQKNGFNADEIAVAANINHKVILGEEPLTAANAMERSDFTQSEWLKVEYKNRNIKDYNKDINDFTGQAARDKLYNTQKDIALEELGYKSLVESWPTIRPESINDLTNLDSRTGMLKRVDADFGSIRESATYIGKQTNAEIRKLENAVAEDYAAFEAKFNAPESGVLRAELELATNFLRTGDVMLVEGNLVQKGAFTQALREAGDTIEETGIQSVIDSLPKGSSVTLGDDVLRVMEGWQREQNIAGKQRQVVSEALGTNRRFDPDILRAPAVDLSRYRMVAFVRPVGGKAANDPTKYMVYAQSAEELNQKIATVRTQLGDDYAVVRQGEDADYFKAMQEYEMGHEFRDLFADLSKENRGRTADILPPLGQTNSRALSDMRRTALRHRQYALRSSIELKNAEALEQLRRYGDYVDSSEKSALAKNFTSRGSHIYTDTVALMLDLPSYKGQGHKLWNEVNTAVAQRGSKVVDFVSAQGTVIGDGVRAVSGLVNKLRGKQPKGELLIPEVELAKINQMMAKNGFTTPIKNVTDLIMQSSDPAVSNSLPELSRSMANLVSLTMLRADPAHSFMQLTSSVILSLPVLRDLRKALPDVADKLTTAVHPTTGFKEPNVHKLYFKGIAQAFSSKAEHVDFRQQLKDRGIISDYIGQFLDTTDMSTFTGAHTISDVAKKQSKVAEFVSKWSGHTASEEHARFALASAVKEMCVARGMAEKEMWPIISNAVDKVHGNYVASQRPQLFNGVVGQNIGLFQTYFFNVMQHMTKHIANGDKKQLALMGGLQAGIFGGQSIPGFNALNSLVANATGADSDLYSITGANDPNSYSAYAMFGLASQAFGIDFSGRGNLNPRYASIVPTELSNLATVSTLTGAIGNLYATAGFLADGNTSVSTALAHGLAHNGMNRPLQGLGTLLQNAVTSGTGQVDVANARMDEAGNVAWGSWFARVIGARPMDEAITRSHFYRQAGYDAAHRDKMAELSATVQAGDITDWGTLATEYEGAGGDLQHFNAFIMRNMQTASEGKLAKFRSEVEQDSVLSRSINRMQYRESLTPYWND